MTMTSFGGGTQQSRKKTDAAESSSSSLENRSKVSKSVAPHSVSVWRKVVTPFLNSTGGLQRKHRMASSSTEVAGVQLAPLRTLDDFLLGSARFQLPNFSDFEKWGKRVVNNLVYYQTNYLILIGGWLILTLIYQPKVAVYSSAILLGSLFAARYCIQTYGNHSGGRENLKYLLCTVGPALVVMYFMELIVFVLFVILMPFCTIFVHASLRLRNLKNKVMNTVESLGIQNTPMGIFLGQMGLLPDGVLS